MKISMHIRDYVNDKVVFLLEQADRDISSWESVYIERANKANLKRETYFPIHREIPIQLVGVQTNY